MSEKYVLDACALIAALSDESGAEVVRELFDRAANGEIVLVMHKVNLLEVYYDLLRKFGKDATANLLTEIRDTSLFIHSELSDDVFLDAGRLKVTYRISLADSIALAQAHAMGAKLVTSDHHEFDVIERNEPMQFLWIR